MTRSTADLITQLQEQGQSVQSAALVVGFDERTEFVWAHEPEPLARLNGLIQKGGEPMAIITHDRGHARAVPVAEYEDEEWVEKYLIDLLNRTRDSFRTAGIKVGRVKAEGG